MKKIEPASWLPLPPFERVAFINHAGLIGARWWHQGMVPTTVSSPVRRLLLNGLLSTGGLVTLLSLGAVGSVLALRSCDDEEEAVGALELQREQGWDVGSTKSLEIPNPSGVDGAGSSDWQFQLSSLGYDLAPGDSRLNPLQVNTLFDVLSDSQGSGVKRELKPMNTWDMGQASLAAEGLADLYDDAAQRNITALVLDLPGPESVAAAAVLARLFTPVFLFDNWPHPLGVVPSHLTLAAALYARPTFVAAARTRAADAPPVFVLDHNRLLPYSNQSDRFDNRYFARMPTAATLKRLEIRRLLYVTANKQEHEQDDLNDDFVDYAKADIDVKMISLYEFEEVSEKEPSNHHSGPGGSNAHRYHGYSSSNARRAFYSSYYRNAAQTGGGPNFEEPLARRSPGASYSPQPRNTVFRLGRLSGDTVHFEKSAPREFGRPSVRSGGGGSIGRVGGHSFG